MLICLLLSQSGQNVARQQVSKVRGQKCVVMWIMAEAIHRHELTKLNWDKKKKKNTQYRLAAYSPVYPGCKWLLSHGWTHGALWRTFTFTITGLIAVAQTQKVASDNSAGLTERLSTWGVTFLSNVRSGGATKYVNVKLQQALGLQNIIKNWSQLGRGTKMSLLRSFLSLQLS